MTEKWGLQTDSIRYKGVFDMKKLYNGMYAWFTKRGYRFMETLHKHKPPETEIEWTAKRKIDDYFLYNIWIEFYIWELEDVEVVRDGKKKTMQKARMKITFKCDFTTDYSGRWEGTWMKKKLEKIYNHYIIRHDILFKHEATLYYVLYELHELTKQLLEMETSGGAY